MKLSKTATGYQFKADYGSDPIDITSPSLIELLRIYDSFDSMDDEELYEQYPLLANISITEDYTSYTRQLKNYFTHEELKEFFMFLQKHDDWCYDCLRNKRGAEHGINYRGYLFYIVKMTSKKEKTGLYVKSNGWLHGHYTGSAINQIEIFKENYNALGMDIQAELVYFTYEPANIHDSKGDLKRIMDRALTKYRNGNKTTNK